MDTFSPVYLSHITRVYPPLKPADGVPSVDVLSAEQRLMTLLPAALRAFYLLAGRRADITSSHHRILPVADSSIVDDVLVFLAENQWVMLWGIRVQDCTMDDPIVYATENTSQVAWRPTGDPTSVFLTSTMYWQAVLGGLP